MNRSKTLFKGGDTVNQNELWAVFAQTGRVEDYLRYREAVMQATAQPQKEQHDGTDGKGTDRPRISYR